MIQNIEPHRYDITFRHVNCEMDDVVFSFSSGKLLCHIETKNEIEYIDFPKVKDFYKTLNEAKSNVRFLFQIDGRNYFDLIEDNSYSYENMDYIEKQRLRRMQPKCNAFAAVTAFQLHGWYKANVYCSCCGGKLLDYDSERARICSECGRIVYPRINPCVIVALTNDDKILLTKYSASHSSYRHYSLIAGFVEVGESLEDTVCREVKEEVGLKVKNIKYFGNQPWSLTDTLLVGFSCELDGSDEIKMDSNELSVAEWVKRDDIPAASADNSVSLTGTMIKAFKDNCGMF